MVETICFMFITGEMLLKEGQGEERRRGGSAAVKVAACMVIAVFAAQMIAAALLYTHLSVRIDIIQKKVCHGSSTHHTN